MKLKAFTFLVVLSLLVAVAGVASPVSAAAYGTSFTTSITYMNVGTGTATIVVDFYAEASGTAIPITVPDLPQNAGGSLYVGSLTSVTAGFKGSAVMSSNQPLAATMVQLAPAGSAVKNRPLSNGFTGGSAYVLIPTALKNTFNTHSIISVQNVDSVAADVNLKFVPVSGAPVDVPVTNLPAGAAKYFDLGTLAALGSAFNGSVQITAEQVGGSTPGAVVATSLEASTTTNSVYAFEGTSQTSQKVYMPSAFCNWGTGLSNSAYAVQNTGTAATDVTVTYSSGQVDGPFSIAGGAKRSFQGCAVNAAGFIGSATISAAAGGQIVAVGKITGGGLSTAFVGIADGSEKLNIPYVRWTETGWTNGTRQRTNIAIQNVGTSALADGAVVVRYYDRNGVLVGTHTLGPIAVGGKVSSNAKNTGVPAADEFGYAGTTFGGSAVVVGPAGSKLAVIARVQTFINGTTSVGEDFNGIP